MNNKGFTIIELTAILVILAAIFLVSFPSLLNMAKVDEEKKYDDMVDNLCLAGRSYIYTNMEEFEDLIEEGNNIDINIIDLIISGSVDKFLKNPKTDNTLEDDSLIYTVSSDNYLECEYVDN